MLKILKSVNCSFQVSTQLNAAAVRFPRPQLSHISRSLSHTIPLYSGFSVSRHLFAPRRGKSPPLPAEADGDRVRRRCLQARARRPGGRRTRRRRRWRRKRGARRTKRPRAREYTRRGNAVGRTVRRSPFGRPGCDRDANRTRDTRDTRAHPVGGGGDDGSRAR